MSHSSLVELKALLQVNKFLTVLDVSHTGMGNEGLDLMCDIFNDENLDTITSFNCAMNEITSPLIMEKLKTGIMKSQLRELDISFNNIGNKGIR